MQKYLVIRAGRCNVSVRSSEIETDKTESCRCTSIPSSTPTLRTNILFGEDTLCLWYSTQTLGLLLCREWPNLHNTFISVRF